jgi:hypothetical protein
MVAVVVDVVAADVEMRNEILSHLASGMKFEKRLGLQADLAGPATGVARAAGIYDHSVFLVIR